jgi:antirestriction protein ArdC
LTRKEKPVNRRDVYMSVSERILTALEAGELAPWQRPWKLSGGYPISLRSGKHYRGINVLLLMMEGYDDPRWGTYKAISEAGGQVRKGERATRIVLWKPVLKHDKEGGEDSKYMLLRDYAVFNAKQADGLPELPTQVEREFTPIEEADRIVRGYAWDPEHPSEARRISIPGKPSTLGPPVRHGFDQAAYNLTRDEVMMPEPKQFFTDEGYYATLFHELVHSTGHEKRLKRIEPALFGTDPYAREELVAEIGSSFLQGMAGFESAGATSPRPTWPDG